MVNMKNRILHQINFTELLEYPEGYQVKSPKHEPPVKCERCCVECETSGVLAQAGGRLTLISHGCDTSEFESLLKPFPMRENAFTQPVMFLLEDPGWDDRSVFKLPDGDGGIRKKVPTLFHYFAPTGKRWPEQMAVVEADGNYYGSYFSYLMNPHGLANLYITNQVKCKRVGVSEGWMVSEKCIERFLVREVDAFAPLLVFCFRASVTPVFRARFPNIECRQLYHPSFIRDRCRTRGITRAEAAAEND